MAGLHPEHIKEEVSICYAHALAAQSGINFEPPRRDNDSVDVRLSYAGRRDGWVISSPSIEIQLKATTCPKYNKDGDLKYKLPIKNFRDLSCITQAPRLLLVLVLQKNADYVQLFSDGLSINGIAYWASLAGVTTQSKSKTVIPVLLSHNNVLTVSTFVRMFDNVGRDIHILSGL